MDPRAKKKQVIISILLAPLFWLPALAQKVQRPPVIGIAFVALQVSDIKKSIAFYSDLLGYTVLPGKATADKTMHAYTLRINARQSIQIADGLPAAQDERLLSVAYQTTNAEAMRLYLQSKGIQVPAALQKENDGTAWFMVADPDHHPIKFIQYSTTAQEQPKAGQQRPLSGRILHAGLTIVSASAADAFYRDILGFSEIWRGGATDSVTSWINMRVPEGTDYLEYMLVKGPVGRQQLGSLHHIALMVPDMQQALDILNIRSKVSAYPVASPRVGRNRRWQLNLFDPDGTRIELMEPFPMR